MEVRKNYRFEYVNENEYKKKERSVRKYNMLAYKKLTFEFYPAIRNGEFLGKVVSVSKKDKTTSYELKLPTDIMFSKVHGDIVVHYTVYEKEHIVLLTNITPDGILDEGHRSELATYKGVMVSKSNAEKDIFKINLINMMNQK